MSAAKLGSNGKSTEARKLRRKHTEAQGGDNRGRCVIEIRVRVSASRTSKGYSTDATFECTPALGDTGMGAEAVEDFCMAQLKRLMGLLEREFPKEVA